MDALVQSVCMFFVWFGPSACTSLDSALPPHPPDAPPLTADTPRPDLVEAIVQPAGDCSKALVLTEFFPDPARVPDGAGEYLELYNAGADPVTINGWRLTDLRRDSHVITSPEPIVLPPGAVFVLGTERDERSNGGVRVDYPYDHFHLSNKSDRVRLEDACGVAVFDVVYPTDPGLPEVRAGRSIELAQAPAAGKTAAWQTSRSRMKRGDHGSPGVVPFARPSPAARPKERSDRSERGEKPLLKETIGRDQSTKDRMRLVEHQR